MSSAENDGSENNDKETSFLTNQQKQAVKKVLDDTKRRLEKMTIESIDRSFTQTALKGVVAAIEEEQKRTARRVLLKTKAELEKTTIRSIEQNIKPVQKDVITAIEKTKNKKKKSSRKNKPQSSHMTEDGN